ncbi:MAG: HAD hydrolase family protein [Candidatus Heimdallarchaeaceae archaeon]
MIIAVDFDGTLVDFKYPEIGEANTRLINILKRLRKDGHTLILWTCREGVDLDKAVQFCKSFNLEFDAVNKNISESIATYGIDARKVLADFYLDDKGIRPEDFLKLERNL